MAMDREGPVAAFTLLELLLVVVIVGVTGAIVVPRLAGSFASVRTGKSAERVFAAAREAQGRAVLRGVRVRLALACDDGLFWIEEERQPLEAPGRWSELFGREGKPDRLEAGVRVADVRLNDGTAASGRVDIGFRPDGSADDARILLENDAGDRRAVAIRGLTGRVRILTDEELAAEAAPAAQAPVPKFQTGALRSTR
jgi:Tfp pilus assembly protein FimT